MSEDFEVIPDNSVHSNVERLLFEEHREGPDEMCIGENALEKEQKNRRRLRSRSRSRSRNANAAAIAVESNTKHNNKESKSSTLRSVFQSSSSSSPAITAIPSPSRRANVNNVSSVKRLPPKPPTSKKWAFPKPYFSSCKEDESPTLPSSMTLREQEDRIIKSYHPPSSSTSMTAASHSIGGMLYQKYHNSMDDADNGDMLHDTTALMSDDELSTQFHRSGPATVTSALSIGNNSQHFHHDDYSVKSSDIYSYVSAQSQSQFGGTIGAVGGGGGAGGQFYNHYYYNDPYDGSTAGGGTIGGEGTVKTFRTVRSQRSARSAKTHKSVRRANRRRKRKKVLKDWKMRMNDSLKLISKMSGFVIGGGAPPTDDHDGPYNQHCPYNHVSDSDGGQEEDQYKSYHDRQLHYMNDFGDEQENCAEAINITSKNEKMTATSNSLQTSPLRPKSTNVPFDETSPLRSSLHSPTGLIRPTRSFSDAVPPPVEAISSHSSFSRGTMPYAQNKGVVMFEKDDKPSEQHHHHQQQQPTEYAQLIFGPGLGLCNGVEESSPPKKNTNAQNQNSRPPRASSPNPSGLATPSTKTAPAVAVVRPSPQRSIKSTPNISSPPLSSPPRRTRTPPSTTSSCNNNYDNGVRAQMSLNTPPSTPKRDSTGNTGANGSTPVGKLLSTNDSTVGSTASPLSMTETIESLRSNPPPPPPLPPRRDKQRSAPNLETVLGNRLPVKKSSAPLLPKSNTFQPATVPADKSKSIDKNSSNTTKNDLPDSRMDAVPKTPPKKLSKYQSNNSHDKPQNPLQKTSLPTDSPTTPTTVVTTASTPTKKTASSPRRNGISSKPTSQVPSSSRNRAASSKIAPSPIRTKQQQKQQSSPTRRAAPVSTTVHKTIHRHNEDIDAYKRQSYGYGVPFGVYIHPTQSCDASIDRERHDDELWETLGSPWDEDIVTVIKHHKSLQKKKYNRSHKYHHDQSCNRSQNSFNNTKIKSKGGGASTRKVAEYLYYKKSGDNGQKVTLKGTTAANDLSGSINDSHPFDEGKHQQQHKKANCQCVRCSAKSIYADLL
mmetsp:Transcript_20289/g.31338  ORF Transcript_20289/g.31338 Transcript_20289/m.31338 type:complete len:1053 (-) Transcript_20289:161-3319(-)|eukprot:CAMPEP_0195293508 /NCGR_PEP_ID=MMETSP0707-20130614/12604_1 /TAXON_ID=33640 /ORGANISM="Asterionellopsis glacialis, Strain CCMP134" /LENGTH=1052 /DNA_ID=CAMNT_0040354243 /DNA_START=28 /DNA_END=3186 /DNA_ORIENTATION=-